MKRYIILSVFSAVSSFAQTIYIAERSFQIAFEDTALNVTNKTIIANDIKRLFAPSTNSAVYISYQGDKLSGRLVNLHGIFLYPKSGLPTKIRRNATNGLDIIVSKQLSDEYINAVAMLQDFPVAHEQAESFSALLSTNELSELTATLANQIFLFKRVAAGDITSEDAPKIGEDYKELKFYPPSLLGYQLLDEGPGNNTFLWGTIPAMEKGRLTRIPVIYYQNQWRISWWFMEPGEQTW